MRARVLIGCLVVLIACGDDADSAARVDAGADAGGLDAAKPDPRAGRDAAAAAGRSGGGAAGRTGGVAGSGKAGSPAAGSGDPVAPPAAGQAPDSWTCPDTFWGDTICDCGCGVRDFDCTRVSCTTLECVADGCDACYTADNAFKACLPDGDPNAWKCSQGEQLDDVCDCGCGLADPACGGSGCSEPGCHRSACGRRHDRQGAELGDPLPPLNGWRCPIQSWGGGDGCDCGCGAKDPDCDPGFAQCTGPRCNAAECQTCHDRTGRKLPCSDALEDWTCDPQRFGAGDGCDCGCGAVDPDCGEGNGCSTFGCRAAGCQRCTDLRYANDALVGCTPDSGWTCHDGHYGTGDGCDCGCGIHDPDCGADDKGCTAPNCQQDTCDYCHAAGVAPHEDDDYVQCNGWSCGSASDPAWQGDACDCGCGKPDPACRKAQRLGCSESGCKTEACEYCNTSGQARAACTGQTWRDTPTCPISIYGRDGLCDCGCGAKDPDCGDQGCTGAFCAAQGCEVCHGSGENLTACLTWHCSAEAYADGSRCDCGCGAPDPDCSMLGCIEPGCWDEACSTDGCHDPFGRTVACP
ncbi:MAG TPA: hypothetical protein VJR89_01945 [Polyangiales bacterium]|nr:hypothetical protein [Polyangiales bacterium]